MALGASQKFHILQQSPHDLKAPQRSAQQTPGPVRWVPSRYNVRAITDEGQMILWNTFNGSMSVFEADQKKPVQALLKRKGVESKSEGVVKYLADRGFLIREGTDEYRKFKFAFGQQHYRTDMLELILLSSEDCNFRCTYCYEKFARGTMEPWVRAAVKKAFDKRLPSLRNVMIKWFGGEPLYGFPAIEELAPYFLEKVKEHGLGYKSHMTTNGYLLTPETAEKLLAWKINHFQITLDGPPESHDCSRPARDGSSTFETIYNNLASMSRRKDDFRVSIRVNFDRSNYPQLDGFFDLVERQFRDDERYEFRFHRVGRWGGDNDDQLEICGIEEGDRIEKELRDEARKRGLGLSGNIKRRNLLGAHACYAARPYSFIVGASGKLMKCTIDLDTQDRNIVGHITPHGDFLLDHNKMAMWTEAAFEDDKKCQKCVVLPVCQGIHCPLERMLHEKSPCTPTRRNLKGELLEAHAVHAGNSRGVAVSAPAGS